MNTVRPPAVAGMFYPAAASELARDIGVLLAGAESAARGEAVPKAIIAPHAGYIYSGAIAATAYARLAPARGVVRPRATGVTRPLRNTPGDAVSVAARSKLPQVTGSPAARRHAVDR